MVLSCSLPPPQVLDKWSHKKRLGANCTEREESRKGSGFLFDMKRKKVHSRPERGVQLICNYLPLPPMISRCLKLIGFLETAAEESCGAALTPGDLEASAA